MSANTESPSLGHPPSSFYWSQLLTEKYPSSHFQSFSEQLRLPQKLVSFWDYLLSSFARFITPFLKKKKKKRSNPIISNAPKHNMQIQDYPILPSAHSITPKKSAVIDNDKKINTEITIAALRYNLCK
jgi:hypothetical protein